MKFIPKSQRQAMYCHSMPGTSAFDFRVIVGSADLRFELWVGGREWLGNHEAISMQWDGANSISYIVLLELGWVLEKQQRINHVIGS
ncbi:unnamed protein product [Clonostachys solani]|uniref:Uncharacterized protein n=1 Tax=Clonostachys solani TaxID=160281 RepID=A0A9N9Z2H4_9HYPO|nr:unnamed protein product [Clonostachys solani]